MDLEVVDLFQTDLIGRVQIFGADGRPLARPDEYGALQTSWPLVAGRARLAAFPAGAWQVRVQVPDGRDWFAQIATRAPPRRLTFR